MLEGILQHRQNSLGLTPDQWRRTEEIVRVKEEALRIISVLEQSPVILELRNLTKDLEKVWIDKGPGRCMTVNTSDTHYSYLFHMKLA
jgi:hypothetical protein